MEDQMGLSEETEIKNLKVWQKHQEDQLLVGSSEE